MCILNKKQTNRARCHVQCTSEILIWIELPEIREKTHGKHYELYILACKKDMAEYKPFTEETL
jgi:hypothetical protein